MNLHLAAQVALEVLHASGERTASRLQGLVASYAKTYGITDATREGSEALAALQASALQRAQRMLGFRADA